jgi:hypothetical protein
VPDFFNHNNYTVHLPGPDGRVVKVKGKTRVVLSEYFERNVQRGFIRKAAEAGAPAAATPPKPVQAKIQLKKRTARSQPLPSPPPKVPPTTRQLRREGVSRARKDVVQAQMGRKKPEIHQRQVKSKKTPGRQSLVNPNELLKSNLSASTYPISNGIGVGILSYNRVSSLRRLVSSIVKFTDLRRTTVFISDDGSTDPALISYLAELEKDPGFVVLRNAVRLGVAGNSNRLLRCLSRFAYGIILNDDVEVVDHGWDKYYPNALQRLNMHHFVYRQEGVYGALRGEEIAADGHTLLRVMERPHGAVLAFTNHCVKTIGHFNEAFGLYGMEHVDWSQRVWEMGLQSKGFFDIAGSENFFHLHSDHSAVESRNQLLSASRKTFSERRSEYVPPTAASEVPAISYVIPFRNHERADSIITVVNNVRAQRWPVIDIILVEQDVQTRIDVAKCSPVRYLLAEERQRLLFNKAKAFNLGVAEVQTESVVLHDADMLAPAHYTRKVVEALQGADACHLGATVIYTSQQTMEKINSSGIVDDSCYCERVVGYYEGGSLACKVRTYWQIGAFNEDFWGYGEEDCDFYARLSESSRWNENRSFDFVHLWHSRVPGWEAHFLNNKQLAASLQRRSMLERVNLQRQQMHRLGYGRFVV